MCAVCWQFTPRLLFTASIQLNTAQQKAQGQGQGQGQGQLLRRTNSCGNIGGSGFGGRVFLSAALSAVISSASPTKAGAVSVLVPIGSAVASAVLRSSIGRVCDSVYESSIDCCCLLLNGAQDPPIVRAALGIMSEVRRR
jgi:hypothetical protein